MAYTPITVTVDGNPVRLVTGCEVKHALNWVGGAALVRRVAAGQAIVWDETAGGSTDLGGALYDGQVLTVKPA